MLSLQSAHLAQHRRFEAAETEVVGIEAALRPRHPALGQGKAKGIAVLPSRLNRRPPRISEPKQAGHLVESFAGGIVVAAAQADIATRPIHPQQLGVAAAHQQHQVGTGGQGLAQLHRAEMTFQVVNGHKGLAMQPRQGAARDRGHQQGPHQARGGGGGDAIELGHGHAAVAAHLLNQLGQGLDMTPRGDFRHHASPAGVLFNLGGDGTREHRLIAHNRCR